MSKMIRILFLSIVVIGLAGGSFAAGGGKIVAADPSAAQFEAPPVRSRFETERVWAVV